MSASTNDPLTASVSLTAASAMLAAIGGFTEGADAVPVGSLTLVVAALSAGDDLCDDARDAGWSLTSTPLSCWSILDVFDTPPTTLLIGAAVFVSDSAAGFDHALTGGAGAGGVERSDGCADGCELGRSTLSPAASFEAVFSFCLASRGGSFEPGSCRS